MTRHRPAAVRRPCRFQRSDADRFFGRRRLVGELLDLLAERRFVTVFGASGAGKSSLLRAGLAGKDHDGWLVKVFTPARTRLKSSRPA